MANPSTLRVRPVGTALVQDYIAMKSGICRFVGRKLDKTIGESIVEPLSGETFRQSAFVPVSEPETIPNIAEYRKAVKYGDLEPADKETALICGVPWSAPPVTSKSSKE